MSTINKKPFIKALIEDLKQTEGLLETLQLLIDGGGNQTPILRTLSIKPSGNRSNITNADKGVCLCNLEANYSLYNGYLCYTDSYCVLISFTDSQKLTMFAITEDGHNFETIDEELNVLELRSELMDIAGSGVQPDQVITIVNESIDDGDINVSKASAPEFNPESAYEAGSLVIHNNILYKNANPVSAGDWNENDWTATTIADAVLGLINTAI